MSVFEVIATGVSRHIYDIEKIEQAAKMEFIQKKAKALWENETFQRNSGAGVRGTTRLTNLLPMALDFFRP